MGTRNDDQFTPEELELMNGGTATEQPQPSDEAFADAAVAAPDEIEADAPAAEAAAADADDSAPEATEEAAEGEDKSFVPRFQADTPADYEAQRQQYKDQKRELRAKWSSGELSDDEWASQESELDDKYEELRGQYLTAQALQKANEQIAAQQAQATLQKAAAEAKRAGVDYSDQGLAALFDSRMNAVANEEAFKGKPFEAIVAEANRRVLGMFNKVPAPADNPKAQGAQPSERIKLPQTLANMPAAAAQPAATDFDEQFASIDDPDILEAKWAQMPTQQRSAMLRSTLPARRR